MESNSKAPEGKLVAYFVRHGETEGNANGLFRGSLDYPPSETPDLRSWNTGYLSGLPKSKHQNDIDFFQKNENTAIPNGESLNQFRLRVGPRIKNSILKGIQSGVPSITFLHSSGIHELSHILYGDHSYIKVKPGGVVGVYHNGNKLSAKALVNESKGHSDEHFGG